MRWLTAPLLVASFLIVAHPRALAQSEGPEVQPPPRLRAVPVSRGPDLDGVVDGDPAWAVATPVTDFWQTMPDEGGPSTEKTDVRVVYTEDTLYVGVVLHDAEPSAILSAGSRRDTPLDDSDAFLFVLDTFHDHQNGFVFGTNPAGIEYDGQVSNEGTGSGGMGFGQQSGSGAGFNLNWDGSWTVRTRVGDYGWSAEFAIPFRTLRYGGSGKQTWGINFQRLLRRRNEVSYWARLPRQFTLHRVSVAGTLDGLVVPSQRNLKLIPYVLREVQRDHTLPGDPVSFRSAGGLDLKWSVTPGLTLDGTLGTDFSQVEVDEQQIRLDRFNLVFPEKRPFFLENAGMFAVGEPGSVDLFFSRRIGIGPAGQIIPIAGGARLSGKAGNMRIGLLDMQAEPVAGIAPANNFGVARLAYELPNRSHVGALFTQRYATGDLDPALETTRWNRTYAADGRVGIGAYANLSGYVAKTESPGAQDREQELAYRADARYDSPSWMFQSAVSRVGRDFNPEVGFLRRSDYTKAEASVMHRWRPTNLLGLYELRPHVSFYDYFRPDRERGKTLEESRFLHIDNHTQWRNGWEVHTGVNFTRESIIGQDFEIVPGVIVPRGTYDHAEAQLVLNTNPAAPIAMTNHLTVGGIFGGKRVHYRPTLRIKGGNAFLADLSWDHNDVSLPGGDFTTNLVRARLQYSFSPRLFAQALLQYNDRANLWSTNLRLGWQQTANAGFFLVYNDSVDTTSGLFRDPDIRHRSLIAKLSLMFDVL